MIRRYIRSIDFPIHALVYWWLIWILVSVSKLNVFIAPSVGTIVQLFLLVASFWFGYFVVKRQYRLGIALSPSQLLPFQANSARMKLLVGGAALACLLSLLICLYLSGAFSLGFVEYFTRLRFGASGAGSITGKHYLDILSKILFFPLSYTIILVILGNELKHYRWVLGVCVLNLLCYSYLWQVNYPFIHLFWMFVFAALISGKKDTVFGARAMFVLVLIFSLLLASAANRFGGDVLGGLQRYVLGYHLVGFSFYDSQYLDPNSLLHSLSFGRSSLGFIDQMLESFFEAFDVEYSAASFQNSTFTDQAVDIGRDVTLEFNAFGTLLFTFYRDFHVIGIIVGGFLYGALATYFRYRGIHNWQHRALFLFLATTWMMGMMVSPLEQAYFWFTIITLNFVSIVNRVVRV